MKTRLLFCGVIVTLSAPLSHAIKYRHDADPNTHLNEGKNYENIALIDTGTTKATGTLIGDRWLLTAAHIMDGTAASTQVTFEDSSGTQTNFKVVEQYIHPNFSGGGAPFYDIGLYKLDAPVTGVTAAELFDPSTSVSGYPVVDSTRFDLAGYGLHGSAAGTGAFDGERRWGENMVEGYEGTIGPDAGDPLLWYSYFDAPGSGFAIANEAIAAAGDSGGGWFFNDGGTETLFALSIFSSISGVIVPDGLPSDGNLDGVGYPSYGDFMVGLNIDPHLDWINETMAVPDAGSSWLLLGGSLATLFAIRRRQLR